MEAIIDAQGVLESIEPTAGVTVEEKYNKMEWAYIFQEIPKDILMQVSKMKTTKKCGNHWEFDTWVQIECKMRDFTHSKVSLMHWRWNKEIL